MDEKRKSNEMNISEAGTVQLAEGQMENQAKKQRMDQMDPMDTEERAKENDSVLRTFVPKIQDD